MITLNGLNLPAALWWDEFDYSPIKQKYKITPSGHVVLMRGKMKEGRPIHLKGGINKTWIKRSQLQAVMELFKLDEALTLNYRGTEYNVKVAFHESDFFKAPPVIVNKTATEDDGMYYIETLKLIEVLA